MASAPEVTDPRCGARIVRATRREHRALSLDIVLERDVAVVPLHQLGDAVPVGRVQGRIVGPADRVRLPGRILEVEGGTEATAKAREGADVGEEAAKGVSGA